MCGSEDDDTGSLTGDGQIDPGDGDGSRHTAGATTAGGGGGVDGGVYCAMTDGGRRPQPVDSEVDIGDDTTDGGRVEKPCFRAGLYPSVDGSTCPADCGHEGHDRYVDNDDVKECRCCDTISASSCDVIVATAPPNDGNSTDGKAPTNEQNINFYSDTHLVVASKHDQNPDAKPQHLTSMTTTTPTSTAAASHKSSFSIWSILETPKVPRGRRPNSKYPRVQASKSMSCYSLGMLPLYPITQPVGFQVERLPTPPCRSIVTELSQ